MTKKAIRTRLRISVIPLRHQLGSTATIKRFGGQKAGNTYSQYPFFFVAEKICLFLQKINTPLDISRVPHDTYYSPGATIRKKVLINV